MDFECEIYNLSMTHQTPYRWRLPGSTLLEEFWLCMINILGPLLVGGEELRQNLVGLSHVLIGR